MPTERCTYGQSTFEGCVRQHLNVPIEEIARCCGNTLGIVPSDAEIYRQRRHQLRRRKEHEERKHPYRKMGTYVPQLYQLVDELNRKHIDGAKRVQLRFEISHTEVGRWLVRCRYCGAKSPYEESQDYGRTILDKRDSVMDAVDWIHNVHRQGRILLMILDAQRIEEGDPDA